MQVEVKFFGSIRFDIGVDRRKFIVKKESTIDDVLNLILSDYGEKARRAFYTKDGKSNKFIVFINNRKIPNLKEVELRNGDTIYFLTPVGGG